MTHAERQTNALATVAATYRLAASIAALPHQARDFAMSVVERGLREKSRRRSLQMCVDPEWLEGRILAARAILEELEDGDRPARLI
jgi:hypothetical protein